MIEETEVDGRKALVAYMDDEHKPVDKEKATQAEVIFTDVEVGSETMHITYNSARKEEVKEK